MMNKEALEYLVEEIGGPQVVEIGGKPYSDKRLVEIKEPQVGELKVSTLTALVEYLLAGPDSLPSKMLVHVQGPTTVSVKSPLFGGFKQRDTFLIAQADLPRLFLGEALAPEDFQIMLRTAFASAGDRDSLLKLAGNVVDEAAITAVDDGVSQETTVRSGVASRAKVKLPNPVTLAPYRAFLEVEQVESPFLFRMHKGPRFSLHEADGGAWRMEAAYRVKVWLRERLEDADRYLILG